jgi:hypothetical protein
MQPVRQRCACGCSRQGTCAAQLHSAPHPPMPWQASELRFALRWLPDLIHEACNRKPAPGGCRCTQETHLAGAVLFPAAEPPCAAVPAQAGLGRSFWPLPAQRRTAFTACPGLLSSTGLDSMSWPSRVVPVFMAAYPGLTLRRVRTLCMTGRHACAAPATQACRS